MAVEGAASSLGKSDPNVQVPAAVKRAAERSEELSRQAAEAKKARPPEADAPVSFAAQQPRPNPGVQMVAFDPNNPQPPGEPSLPQSNLTPRVEEPQDWEHQFKSLKGRHDRAEQDNKRLAGQIGDMQRLIASMNVGQQPQPQEGSGVRFTGQVAGTNGRQFPQGVKRVTEKEISDYGNDLIDVMGRRAMEVQDATLAPQLFALQNELTAIRQQLGGVSQTVAYDAQSRMYQQLDREIPNWKQINSHPDFVSWLQMPDPLSGQIRHSLLGEAYNSQQANRVMEFFRRFVSEHGQQQSNGNGALTAGSYDGSGGSQMDLLALAAPGRAKSGQTQVGGDKGFVSPAEIKQFYTDAAGGKYRGREEEYNRIQNEIFAASREGRVRS